MRGHVQENMRAATELVFSIVSLQRKQLPTTASTISITTHLTIEKSISEKYRRGVIISIEKI